MSAEIKIHFFPILMIFEFDFMINTHATKVEDESFAGVISYNLCIQ